MTNRATVLIAEDDNEMRRLLGEVLESAGYSVLSAQNGSSAMEKFLKSEIDVVVTDHRMPGMDGREVLSEMHRHRSDVPVIIITAFGNIESAVDAMRGGAYHYLAKPFRMDEFLITVEAALRERRLLQQLNALREVLKVGTPDLIAESTSMRKVLDTIGRAAPTDTAVLLIGESGTGKELLARVLHTRSPRVGKPFMALNCAAIPESLLESQLFGHRRGSFTDAKEDRPGLFLDAYGGTVFLDEVGDMPIALQGKLLRVLQEREVHPLGASAPVPVDVRIIAATHRDLPLLVEKGTFREDLFYRLNVISVRIPPLRERRDDIIPLIAHLLDKHGARLGRPGVVLSAEALERMQRYGWPGNVRELENAIERALVLGRGEQIGVEDLPETLLERTARHLPAQDDAPRPMAEIEREHILRVLRTVGGNKASAARILGMDRKTLYRKLEVYRLGTETDDSDRPEPPHV